MGDDSIITIRGLEKRFGKVRALSGVTLDVPPGSVGLLGPNGAGKTTMIKLLLGLLVPDAGDASIAGHSPRRRSQRIAVRKVVGYMPEGDCLLPEMSGVELVATLGRITGLRREDAMTRAHEVLDYVELEEARYRKLVEYSTGMKQRLKLAQALVHDPRVLLLDEPTNGLDPKGRRHMLEIVDDLGRNQGKNVLLCSHLLRDVERTCDHVIVLDKGVVVEQGSVAEMTSATGTMLRLRIDGGEQPFRAGLRAAGLEFEDGAEGWLTVHMDAEADDADALFELAARTGTAITSLDQVRASLQEVFLRAVGVPQTAGNGKPEEQ